MIKQRIIGALSGTSMDGISVGLFEFAANEMPNTIAAGTYAVPANYKQTILDLIQTGSCTLLEYGQLDRSVGEIFAAAINQFLSDHTLDPGTITAIGSHGQTLWHAPHAAKPFTLQIGDPNIIAALTGITTIADFRRADMAAGGCGAPLAPALHQAIFADPKQPRCIVNIGGFSNISILTPTKQLGFDTGPGNSLMDYWVKTHFNLDYDAQGALAAKGRVNQDLLTIMLTDPFFHQAAPKSTGREYFNAAWIEEKLQTCNNKIEPQDVLTTLLHLTAITIAQDIKRYAPPTTQVNVCGGGAFNTELCKQLGLLLEQDIATTAALGLAPDHVEAALFAWLAYARLQGRAINLMHITGSNQPVILGGIYAV